MLRRPPRSTRTDTLFPTRRSSDLWFVDLTRETRHDGQAGPGGPHAITRPAIDAVESGRIRFVPDNWKTTYFQWLNNIQDWCISRQLWWGHRIPAWFDDVGNVSVAHDQPEVRAKYKLGADAAPIGSEPCRDNECRYV